MRTEKIGSRIIALFLSIVMFVTLLPVSNGQVKAASNTLNASDVVAVAKSLVGTKRASQAGRCLGFCATLYRDYLGASTANARTTCCAYAYSERALVSTSRDNIPLGSLVFFSGNNGRCSTCKNNYGHVGIYVGNNEVVSIQGKNTGGLVSNRKISTWESWGYPYLGWGYMLGIEIKQDGGGADTNIPSNIYISDAISYPTGNLSLGQSYPVGGTIYSSNPLTSVTGTIYNSANAAVQQKSVNPNATSYNLRGPINNAMIFNNLSAGSYRFVVSASDNKGYSKNVIESNFTVGTIPAPSIASSDVAGGVKISMSASQGTIHYTLDGSEPTTASPVYTRINA